MRANEREKAQNTPTSCVFRHLIGRENKMKNKLFTESALAAVVLILALWGQTTNAESGGLTATNLASCRVRENNANFFVTATEKDMKLKKGTALSWTIPDLHQGLIVVKAKVGTKWIKGEILMDDTTCR